MAKVKIQGNASGTGVLTVTAPNTSTDRTITLPDSTGTLLASEGAVVVNESGADVDFRVESDNLTHALFVQGSTGEVGIRTNSPTAGYSLHVGPASGVHTKVKIEATTATGQAELDLSADPAGVSYLNLGDENSYNIGRIGYFHSDDSMRFRTNGSERMRILAGGGLTFNGDTAAANALDDYEEGTYTAVVTGSTSGTFNMAGASDTLAYTKVGRLVTIQGYVSVTSGSVSGNVRLSLPFAPTSLTEDASYNFPSLFIANTGTTNSGQKYLFLQTDGSAYFYKVEDNGTAGYMHQGDMDNSFQIGVSFTYISG